MADSVRDAAEVGGKGREGGREWVGEWAREGIRGEGALAWVECVGATNWVA